ncbi:MAG: hypothetical protein ACP5RT_01640 [Candidatus Micrarchaeia archaeon]
MEVAPPIKWLAGACCDRQKREMFVEKGIKSIYQEGINDFKEP